MDTVERYRQIVRALIAKYAAYKPSIGDVELEVVIDPAQDHYELLQNGWTGNWRVEGGVIHIDIRDGKVWIQHDGTDQCLACELEEAGIPKSDIVLAFRHPSERHLSGYAVG